MFLLKIFGVSKYGHNHAETVIAVRIAVRVVESEHTIIGRVVAVATTNEERIV